jgi:hypothetical protein
MGSLLVTATVVVIGCTWSGVRRPQASIEFSGFSETPLLPFPVQLGQRRLGGRLLLGCPLLLSIGALSRPGLKGG